MALTIRLSVEMWLSYGVSLLVHLRLTFGNVQRTMTYPSAMYSLFSASWPSLLLSVLRFDGLFSLLRLASGIPSCTSFTSCRNSVVRLPAVIFRPD
jgi:hypothetical protein